MEIRRIETVSELPAVAASTPLTPQQRAEQVQLIHAVEKINDAQLMGQSSELEFAFDRQTKRPIMRIIDKETKEVIRQLPPEYILRLASEQT